MSPSSYVKGVTPIEAWSGEKPNVDHFKTFGNIAFVHMPKKLWSKLDNKTTQGLFMGYKGKSYKAKVPTERKLCINKDVVVENPLTLILLVEGIMWNLKNKVVEVQQSNGDLSGDLQSIIIVEENANRVPKSCSMFVKTPWRPSRENNSLKC